MLRRFAANVALIFLFAFAQIGAITHEISHYGELAKHHQQDQHTDSQCVQCISYTEVSGGLPTQIFTFLVDSTRFIIGADTPLIFQSLTRTYYAARAPPLAS